MRSKFIRAAIIVFIFRAHVRDPAILKYESAQAKAAELYFPVAPFGISTV